MRDKKAWTVLIYANGNNDLDTYIYRQFQMIKDARLPENINVVIQTARRQSPVQTSDAEPYVCRYEIIDNNACLIERLDGISMAEPLSLLQFLIWGKNEFPSERLMVIISGHGFGFVGLLGDSKGGYVYLMGVQEFGEVLSRFRQLTNESIDILVFDVCYMNQAEVLYELSMSAAGAVRFMVLSQQNTSVEGLTWSLIINGLGEGAAQAGIMAEHVQNTVECVNKNGAEGCSVFAVCTVPDYFAGLKFLIDELSGIILSNNKNGKFSCAGFDQKDGVLISIPYLMDQITEKYDETKILEKELNDLLEKIIICPKLNEIDKKQNCGLQIFFPNDAKLYGVMKKYYDRMLFCVGNRWLKILAEETADR